MKIFNKVFDVTYDAESHQDALDWASGFVFMECETHMMQKPLHCQYIGNVQGDVDVYYDFAANYYFFVEQDEVNEVNNNDTEVDDE